MEPSSTRVGTGEHPYITITNDIWTNAYFVRGTPFETEIGVGKVIKGWDEGRLRISQCSTLNCRRD